MECLEDDILTQPNVVGRVRADRGGRTNPPSAPPAIPPIIIEPVNRQIPAPTVDPRQTPPGPPIVPPPGPDLRM
jgi:hypothetical protein